MNVEKEDKILFCRDCGEEFIFSAREQEFYIQKGFENDPARCGSCRAQRKRAGNAPMGSNMMNQQPNYNNPGGGYGNNYNNGNTRGGYGNFNPGYGSNTGYNNPRPNNGGYSNQGNSYGNQANSYGNNRGYAPRPNNYANPRPTSGGYPSNQGNSYGNQGNSYGNNRSGYPSNQGNSYGNSNGNFYPSNQGNYITNSGYDQLERKRYPIVCANCGIKTEVPFVPREGVPVFCRTCYNNQKPNHN